jgi:hypothetical protein
MSMKTRTRCSIALVMSLALFSSSIEIAHAGVIGTQQYLSSIDRAATIEHIDAVLARDEVRQELERLGVDPAAAQERVAALTDQELETLSTDLDRLPAGGSVLGLFGVVFIVLLILELVGVIDIFKKI